MSPDQPQLIEPLRLADEEQSLQGVVNLTEMERLRQLICNDVGDIFYTLHFNKDDSDTIVISGDYRVELLMECQRCLEPCLVYLNNDIKVGFIKNETEAKILPEDLEPLLGSGEKVSLSEFLEEEILLGLPVSPLHEKGQCPASELVDRLAVKKANPFAVLKDLKINKS